MTAEPVLWPTPEGPTAGGYAAAARVTMPEIPVPFSPPLEDAVLPSPERVVAVTRRLLGERVACGQRGV